MLWKNDLGTGMAHIKCKSLKINMIIYISKGVALFHYNVCFENMDKVVHSQDLNMLVLTYALGMGQRLTSVELQMKVDLLLGQN